MRQYGFHPDCRATLCIPPEQIRCGMDIIPKLNIDRFAQLSAGDLFIFAHDAGACVAIKVMDPNSDGDTLVLPLGPAFPPNIICPTLMAPQGLTAISFEKDYTLRLPSLPRGWLAHEPAPDKHCLVVTQKGVFIRANWSAPNDQFRPCYVDIDSGAVVASSGGYRQYPKPAGIAAYAIEWTLLTNEKDHPRVILAYPT
jgi:hypothetical protein